LKASTDGITMPGLMMMISFQHWKATAGLRIVDNLQSKLLITHARAPSGHTTDAFTFFLLLLLFLIYLFFSSLFMQLHHLTGGFSDSTK
jgi:membrane-associated phospholipid phosphatase